MSKQTFQRIVFLAIFSSLIFLSSCKKDEEFSLAVESTDLDIGFSDQNNQITISNTSDKTVTWYAEARDSFISFDQTTGSLEAKADQNLMILVDRDQINSETTQTEVYISSNKSDRIKINITIHDLMQDKQLLYYQIRNAVYDETQNKLYILQYEYKAGFINIYDVDQRVIEKRIEISSPLSWETQVILDNSNALMGIPVKDSFITITTDQEHTIKTYPIDIDPNYFTGVGYACFGHYNDAYLFPKTSDGNAFVVKIDLSSAEQEIFDLNFPGYIDRVQIHPYDNFIYASTNRARDMLIKIDARDHNIELIYEVYIKGFRYDFWMNSAGDFLFSLYNRVVSIDPFAVNEDIIYDTYLDYDYDRIKHVSFNKYRDEIVIVPWGGCSREKVLIYNEQLSYVRDIKLDELKIPNNSGSGLYYDSERVYAHSAFVLKGGNQLLVLEDPNPGGELFAIGIYDLN